jgi:hypothetical protein
MLVSILFGLAVWSAVSVVVAVVLGVTIRKAGQGGTPLEDAAGASWTGIEEGFPVGRPLPARSPAADARPDHKAGVH